MHPVVGHRQTAECELTRGASVSIVLTCRDEKDNIEPLLRAIPRLAEAQEIIFVEGHSIDGTRAEIERCIAQYNYLGIRLIDQPGIGQGDAILAGFSAAKGDILILLEADMTSPPTDIHAVFEPIFRGEADFVQGSRLAKRMPADAMPSLNLFGNRLFALWFSLLLRQRMTDVLGGIKGLRKSTFERIAPGWGRLGIADPFGDFELLLGASRTVCRIAEAPISYRSRSYGKSKSRLFAHGAALAWIAMKASIKRWC